MKYSSLRKRFKNPLAFTLVELVVVIALLAILASAITPSLRKLQTNKTDQQLQECFKNVQKQAGLIKTTYNNAMKNGEVPRIAGYNLTTAKGIQECLRSSNNDSATYDIEVTTISDTPDPNLYNYIDTIVVCVQFYTKTNTTTPICNDKGVPCSPEQATSGVVPYSISVVRIWYVRIDMKSRVILSGGVLNS